MSIKNYCKMTVSINRCYATKTLAISHFLLAISHFLKDTSFWELYLECNICHGFWKPFSLIYASLGAFQYSSLCFLISLPLYPPACDLETIFFNSINAISVLLMHREDVRSEKASWGAMSEDTQLHRHLILLVSIMLIMNC